MLSLDTMPSGHPGLSPQQLERLRRLVRAVARPHRRVPVKHLAALAAAGLPGTLTIDVAASEALGMPLLVLSPLATRRLARLGPRELEITALIAEGLANKQIAARLCLTLGTVKNYVHRILVKTELPNRAAIAAALTGRQSSQR